MKLSTRKHKVFLRAVIACVAVLSSPYLFAQDICSAPPTVAAALKQEHSRQCESGPCILQWIDETSVSWAFQELLLNSELPGGIAELPDFSEKSKYKFKPLTLKLEDLLNALVYAEPKYRWSESGGVLNLAPDEDLPLLNTVIAEFNVKDATVIEIVEALKANTEFKDATRRLNFGPRIRKDDDGYGFIMGASGKPPTPAKKVSIRMQHSTVRQILNEVVRQEGLGIWSYRQSTRLDGTRWFDLDIGFYCAKTNKK
jgi:hypothetical protein